MPEAGRGSPPPSVVFPQSVASGDPAPDGALLWTRVDMPALALTGPVTLGWTVAADPEFRTVLVTGTTVTDQSRDGTVKVFVSDPALRPATHYWYRFTALGTASRSGRLRTLPEPDSALHSLRLGYASCQDWTNGYFTALGALADQDVDYVLHLGDYVYEAARSSATGTVRALSLPSGSDTAQTLADYRSLYRTYKTDPDLQRCHERHTFLAIWDDHEFADDCYGVHASGTADPAPQPERRAAATRAWAEFSPTACHLTSGQAPPGSVEFDPGQSADRQVRLWREVRFGTLVHAVLTDERLHRDAHPCGEQVSDKYLVPGCAEVSAPGRTMLGAAQRDWLVQTLGSSGAAWKLWANQTMLMQLKLGSAHLSALLALLPRPVADRLRRHLHGAGDGLFVNLDQWDGYQAERAGIARTLIDARVTDLVTMTGDLHSSVAGWSRVDYDAPPPIDFPAVLARRTVDPTPARGDLLGTCFMATSVSAANLVERFGMALSRRLHIPVHHLNRPVGRALEWMLAHANPHLALFESGSHGFNVAEFTDTELTVTMWAVASVAEAGACQVRAGHRFLVPRQTAPDAAPLIHRLR